VTKVPFSLQINFVAKVTNTLGNPFLVYITSFWTSEAMHFWQVYGWPCF